MVDVETTGQNRFLHWMPCFAACVVDESGASPPSAQFLCYLQQPAGTSWDAHCCKHFWKSKKKAIDGELLYDRLQREAAQCGVWEPTAGMSRFGGWLKRMAQRYPRLQVASDNPSYDIAWLDHYLQLYGGGQSMAYAMGEWRAVLDVRSYAAAKGCALSAESRDHNPLSDAMQIGQDFRKLERL